MEEGFNVTYLTVDGFVELDKYRYLYFVILFTAYVLIICSNSIIVYLIWIHPNLHEPMYIFIAALSVNSVLFSSAIYPKLLMDSLSDRQIISFPACLTQMFFYYSLGASDALLLAAMAYDRYVSICKPLQYPTIMRKRMVSVFLVVAWLLPAGHLVVTVSLSVNTKLCSFILKGLICNNSIHKLSCVSSRMQSVFGIVILFNVGLLPVLFILFTYSRILIVSHRTGGGVRRKAAQTCLPHLIVLITFSCLAVFDVILARLDADLSKTVRLIMTLQILLYNPLFNPIIYGLKMKELYKHLKRLLCCHKQH